MSAHIQMNKVKRPERTMRFGLLKFIVTGVTATAVLHAGSALSGPEPFTGYHLSEKSVIQKMTSPDPSDPDQAPKPEKKRPRRRHSHGWGTLEVALEKGALRIVLDVPAHDAVGFEHQPRNPAQEQAVRAAVESLSQPNNLFAFPDGARCSPTEKPQVQSEQFSALESPGKASARPDKETQTDSKEAQDKKHKHKKGHGHRGEHSSFVVKLSVQCADVQALKSIEVRVFQALPRLGLLETVVFTENLQRGLNLTRKNSTLNLENGT